jgi:uroporphyrinogen-III synthase
MFESGISSSPSSSSSHFLYYCYYHLGSDIDKLPDALKTHDIIVITSPQAANVFLTSWEKAGKPNIKVATVGKGSSKPLISKGITPVFEPSDSTAETLAAELPSNLGTSVLYPSSAIAENTLEKGLQSRNFKVTRLNTYNTVPAVWTNDQEALAKSVDIVTFGSPSAVKTWAEKVGTDFTAVVIGPTSLKSAEKLGYKRVIAPANGSKGIEAWADAVATVADALGFT